MLHHCPLLRAVPDQLLPEHIQKVLQPGYWRVSDVGVLHFFCVFEIFFVVFFGVGKLLWFFEFGYGMG